MLDRKSLKRPFTKERAPDWICPTCRKGVLRIKADTFHSDERRFSRDRSHDAWEPEWIQYVFSCLLYCTNDKCNEVVACSGIGSIDWSVEQDADGIPEQVHDSFFEPKRFEPPLRIIDVPAKCPETVSEPIEESFGLVFASPSSAANSIRVAVEQLLTELKIKRFNSVGGKRRYISLHQRISMIPAKYSEIKDLILAIKWLGNAGSHSRSKISFDDVMDAYEFLEHILQEVYVQNAKTLKAKARVCKQKEGACEMMHQKWLHATLESGETAF